MFFFFCWFFSTRPACSLAIPATMTLIQRVALGAIYTAMHLASTQAFLPSLSLSGSPLKHVPASGQTVGNDVRRNARSSGGRGRRTGTVMSAGEHDLFVVGAGYLGWVQGRSRTSFYCWGGGWSVCTHTPCRVAPPALLHTYIMSTCRLLSGVHRNRSSPCGEGTCVGAWYVLSDLI